jgi:ClpP class serine protease
VTAYIDGWSASAATIIMLAADEIVGMPGMELMIHKASMQVSGNDTELMQLSLFLGKQDQNIACQYASKAGGDPLEWLAMMADETWFLADEALDAGLIDRLWSSGNAKRGERVASDPLLTRAWEGVPYRYVNRSDAPVTQQRAALMGHLPPAPIEVVPEVIPGGADNRSTPPQAGGRSIALIQATLAADGVETDW